MDIMAGTAECNARRHTWKKTLVRLARYASLFKNPQDCIGLLIIEVQRLTVPRKTRGYRTGRYLVALLRNRASARLAGCWNHQHVESCCTNKPHVEESPHLRLDISPNIPSKVSVGSIAKKLAFERFGKEKTRSWKWKKFEVAC